MSKHTSLLLSLDLAVFPSRSLAHVLSKGTSPFLASSFQSALTSSYLQTYLPKFFSLCTEEGGFFGHLSSYHTTMSLLSCNFELNCSCIVSALIFILYAYYLYFLYLSEHIFILVPLQHLNFPSGDQQAYLMVRFKTKNSRFCIFLTLSVTLSPKAIGPNE